MSLKFISGIFEAWHLHLAQKKLISLTEQIAGCACFRFSFIKRIRHFVALKPSIIAKLEVYRVAYSDCHPS